MKLKLLIFNIGAIALVGAAFGEGYAQQVFTGDVTHLTLVIVGVFLIGLGQTWKATRGDKDTSGVRHTSKTLVSLGLIGTVLGFIIALSGVNAASAGNLSGATESVTWLIIGMKVALFTTLAGSVLSLWLDINRRIIDRGK